MANKELTNQRSRKMKTFNLIATASFLILSATANAKLNTSKIVCTYNSSTGSPQTVTFESPEGTDLSDPSGAKTIPLRINGSAEPTIFQIRHRVTHVGEDVIYFFRNPLFISDITITYSIDQVSGGDELYGTWTLDHPPVLKLNCQFPEASQP
jgi:hypothetical protein